MFDDIIKKKEPSGMICCATCLYGQRQATADKCPQDHIKCFNSGTTKIYGDFERFNPVYRYSEWEPIDEIRNVETEI